MQRKHVGLLRILGMGAAFVTMAALSSTPVHATLLNAEWKFDEAAGTTAADSAGGLNGTLGTGASFTGGGKIGGQVNLDGASTASVTVGDDPALRPATISVSTWVNTTDTNFALGVWDKYTNSFGFSIVLNNNLPGQVGVPTVKTNATQISSNVDVADGTWHQVTGVYEVGVGSRIYVDGSLKATDNAAVYTPTNPKTLYMGGDGGFATNNMMGGLDDAAVWNVGLTNGEAGALFNVADYAMFNYDAGQADQLFSIHRAGSGSTVIDGLTWNYATGLSGGLGAVAQSGNTFSIRLDALGGGVIATVPEPASAAMLMLGGVLALRRRK